jgi:hypothetical protein
MQELPAVFNFKENVLVPCVVSTFFGLAAAVVTLACLLKLGENPVWLVPGVAAGALTFVLLRFAFNSFRLAQSVEVTPQSIVSTSQARGRIEIDWREVRRVSEQALKGDNVRRAMPGLEIMLSMYINLPLASSGERPGLILIEGPDNQNIIIRSHLLYPHRLEQLRNAISRYAPGSSKGMQVLHLNLNN